MKTSPVLSVCWQQGYEIRQDSLNIAILLWFFAKHSDFIFCFR